MSEQIKPYDERGEKSQQVRSMFDRIARRYDLLNIILSFGIDRSWRRKTVRRLRQTAPGKVLDLATGTGDLALLAAKRIPDAEITGVDLSPDMLRIAAKKIEKRNLAGRIALLEGRAEALPLPDAAYDAATVGFGVRNFADISKGMQEIARVLRPGGKVFVLEFAMPRGRVFGRLYHFYFRRWLPFLGGIVSGEGKAYRYLQQSVEAFPYGERFAGVMSEAGFDPVVMVPMTRGLVILYVGEKRS